MGKFLNGVAIGVGIGLLIAPKKGEETRRFVTERVNTLKNKISGQVQDSIDLKSRDTSETVRSAYAPQKTAAESLSSKESGLSEATPITSKPTINETSTTSPSRPFTGNTPSNTPAKPTTGNQVEPDLFPKTPDTSSNKGNINAPRGPKNYRR